MLDHRQSRMFIVALSLVCLCLGAFGLFGVWEYIRAPASNASRYQALFVPVFSMLMSAPTALITFILYMLNKSHIHVAEAWLVAIGCAMPAICLIGFVIAIALSQWQQ
jgi:hypothetical protein